ncbi:MAG: hypothetical protein IKN53_02620, partial [Oscillibacter sp.]|nr:hypothetical protein [Oscillibacter sp.]
IVFLYPLIAAIPATYEGPVAGTAFALGAGVFCDLLLPSPIPCFYTLIFPLAGLCAAILAKNLLSAGVLCSLAAGAAAFLLTGLFHAVVLWLRGQGAWGASVSVTARELLVSLPWAVPMTFLFRAVHLRTRTDD